MAEQLLRQYRSFLKDTVRLTVDFSRTAQQQGVAAPAMQKPVSPDRKRIELIRPGACTGIVPVSLATAISGRRSRRKFSGGTLTLDELSFLLWATQGVQRVFSDSAAFRTVPSAGARHALETYLAVSRVEGLEPGLYRYLPIDHQLVCEKPDASIAVRLSTATLGQRFVADAAVSFVWTAIPFRMEWRYGMAAHKVIAIDSGHVCQNLYLACEAVAAGCCAIAAYDQTMLDGVLGVDGEEEFAVYLAPVGKIK